MTTKTRAPSASTTTPEAIQHARTDLAHECACLVDVLLCTLQREAADPTRPFDTGMLLTALLPRIKQINGIAIAALSPDGDVDALRRELNGGAA